MDRVSCKAFPFVRGVAEAGGVSLEGLFDDLPERAHWERPDGWVTWAQWVTLLGRLEVRFGGDEARLVASGRVAMRAASGSTLGRVAGLLPEPQFVYEVQARWVWPSLFHCVRFDATLEPGGAYVRCEVRVVPEAEPCRAWLVMLEGALASVSTLGGLEEVSVERLELEGRRGAWRVRLPPRVGEGRTRSDLPLALVDELISQQATLARAYDEQRATTLDFRTALDGLPLLMAVHESGELRWVNQAFAAQFRRPPEALVGTRVEELFTEPQRARVRHLLESTSSRETLLLGSGAAMRTLEAQSGGASSLGGKPGSLVLLRDVTDELEAKRRSTRSESALAALLDALPDLVMRFGADTTLLGVYGGREFSDRAAIEPMVGQRLDEIQRRWGIHDEPRARRIRQFVQDTLQSGEPGARTYEAAAADGTVRYLLVRAVPHDGEVLLISQDRTVQVGHERRLQHAERMASLGELAAGVAHDVNNPLTAVMASLPVLRHLISAPGGHAEALEVLGELEEGCRRISEITSRMREFSEVSPPSRSMVRVADVAARAALLTRTELRYRARLELSVDPALRAWADAGELEEVLVNLLVNAAQAMPAGAGPETHRVSLRGRADAAWAVLEVEDDGVGIAAEVLPRIFDPFFTTRNRGAGRGLGLAISHRIVIAHGGSIDARSTSGHTTLTVRLPLAEAMPARVEESAETSSARRARVLVIDDEPSVGRSIQRLLLRHDVSVLGDGHAAFTRLREGELPDLVLCDLMMPGCTGMELYAALRHARPEVLERVAFMSGGPFTPPEREFLEQHPVSLLSKPFAAGSLDALVQRVLAAGRLEVS